MFQGKVVPEMPPADAAWGAQTPGAAPAGPLDLLGRMPIPLRRPVRAGLERALAGHDLVWDMLMGGEWYDPFDRLLATADGGLPGALVTPWMPDALTARLLGRYGAGWAPAADLHPACAAAGLADPEGVFVTLATIPMVFLVDHVALAGRPAPRRWADLLGPRFRGEVVFGGWRPNDRVPFTDYNSYLLLGLAEAFGPEAVRAFAASVKTLRHNVVSARTAGSGAAGGGAVAILPWSQADLAPRRDRTEIVWPEEGAIVMPIGCFVRPGQAERLRPVLEYLTGPDLGRVLAANRYPAAFGPGACFPEGARLLWLGWDRVRGRDMVERARAAGRLFFESWEGA